ncbi:unnamed protein product [Cuscuta epithymum]|uniref:RING-type domain-containing protein n=1 Tax=Cuscuta epithymum TaxID=186058 RepID=A0AAV0EW09_9ASTE|nr:unnamed protein product [Cuscuta epithymum]
MMRTMEEPECHGGRRVTFMVSPYEGPPLEDDPNVTCAAACHPHAIFSLSVYDPHPDRDGGYFRISNQRTTVCLPRRLFSENREARRAHIRRFANLSHGPTPIRFNIQNAIADDVMGRAGNSGRNLEVRVLSSLHRDGVRAMPVIPPPGIPPVPKFPKELPVKSSTKRKRIEEGGENSAAQDRCVICLEEMTAGTEVPVLPCDHCSFHEDCLRTWFQNRLVCPLCRRRPLREGVY